ncbi:MAG TPA: hypothetical protein VGJ48_19380 [Pyrinomonadaceae bacterium]|jgi:hypothetical protein
MFKREGALLVRVTLNASGIGAGGEPRLLEFETAMWIMAITTFHHSLKNLVMKRLIEIWLRFTMATHAELWLTGLQHVNCGEARLFCV